MRFSSLFGFIAVGSVCVLSACQPMTSSKGAYWQRVEAHSAMYLTGPKAQQQLDQNIARCVREIDELVRLGAIRETTPPDTNHDYHDALNKSGDLSHWDTPTRAGKNKVDHSDFHDFEGCMRSDGWERVKYVRYHSSQKAMKTHEETQELRKYGVHGEEAKMLKKKLANEGKTDFSEMN